MSNLRRTSAAVKPAAAAWRAHAPALAEWADGRLVNRRDVWGQYLPLTARTEKRKAITQRGQLTLPTLVRHFRGESVGDLIGLPTTAPNNTCRFVVVDIDQHEAAGFEKQKRINRTAAIRFHDRLVSVGFHPLLISSNGRGGYHIWVIFAAPIPSELAFGFAQWLVRDWKEMGLASAPEAFPKQPRLDKKATIGNWVRLPGRHHTFNFYSHVWNGPNWLSGTDAINKLLSARGDPPGRIPAAAHEFAKPVVAPGARQRELEDHHLRPIERVLKRLTEVRRGHAQWYASCPAHCDERNSLSVAEGDDGRVLVKCFAGCEFEEIVSALQMEVLDFFPSNSSAVRVRRTNGGSAIRHRGKEGDRNGD